MKVLVFPPFQFLFSWFIYVPWKIPYNMTMNLINVFRSQEIEGKRLKLISWLKEVFFYHPSPDILPSAHPNSIRNSSRKVSNYCNCCNKKRRKMIKKYIPLTYVGLTQNNSIICCKNNCYLYYYVVVIAMWKWHL